MVMVSERGGDISGRLKEVYDDQEELVSSFEYDAYGRRVSHHALSTDDTAHYYYDGWRVIEEYIDPWDDDTFLQARNVWGLYLDEMVVRWAYLGEENNQDFYPVLNPIYSPLRIYDQDGNLEVRMKYTPYGKPEGLNPDGSSTLIAENVIGMVNHDYPMLFTGQRHDASTGLAYFKHRYLSPPLGRFVSRDPLGIDLDSSRLYTSNLVPASEPGIGPQFLRILNYEAAWRTDPHFYSYAGAAPSRSLDGMGLFPCCRCEEFKQKAFLWLLTSAVGCFADCGIDVAAAAGADVVAITSAAGDKLYAAATWSNAPVVTIVATAIGSYETTQGIKCVALCIDALLEVAKDQNEFYQHCLDNCD